MKQIAFTCLLFFGLTLFSQKEKKPIEKQRMVYKEATVETNDYKIYIVDVISSNTETKFKMRVFNKTNDYLLIKSSEIILKGATSTFTNAEQNFVVSPNDQASDVLHFEGSGMVIDNYNLIVKGVYKASAAGNVPEVPNFILPPTKNEFTNGKFNCVLTKKDLNTDKSVIRFECTYNGDGVGIINPYKTVAVMPNKTDNSNAVKSKVMVLEKAEKVDFTLAFKKIKDAGDMQKEPFEIKWGETFRESKLVLLKGATLPLEKDAAKTDEKNK